jgi:hypothetical protein
MFDRLVDLVPPVLNSPLMQSVTSTAKGGRELYTMAISARGKNLQTVL